MVGKSSDIRNHARNSLSEPTLQNRLLRSESLSLLKEVRFNEPKFLTSIPVSNIKYHHPKSQNNNLFCLFQDQLDNALVYYSVESKTSKGNTDKFLSKPLMFLFTEKLSYQNTDK